MDAEFYRQELDPVARRVTPLPFLALLALALIGNVASVQLFPGVDFLFGSIAVMVALRMYGTGWGVLVAAVSSGWTIALWNHPWAAVIFTLEALVVGLLLDRMRRNLVLADTLYWIVVGIGLVFLTYSGIMGVDGQNTLPIALKQSVNGIFNALVASLLLDHSPLSRRRNTWAVVPLQRLLFHLLTVLVLGTAFVLTVLGVTEETRRLENEVNARIGAAVRGLRPHLDSWVLVHLRAVEQLAAFNPPPWNPADLQKDLALVHRLHPQFHNLYVADENGVAVAFDPLTSPAGRSTLGLDFSDRSYFRQARLTGHSLITNVFQGRGGVEVPIVTVVAPIMTNGTFHGVVLGALDLEQADAMLAEHVENTGLRATLVTAEGEVVASSDPGLVAGVMFDHLAAADLVPGREFSWQPDKRAGVPTITHWDDATLGHVAATEGPTDWRIVVEATLGPQQAYLRGRYVRVLLTMLALTLFVLPLAAFVSRRITGPLQSLADRSTDLPHRLEHGEPVDWPRSRIREINALAANFQVMAEALRERVAALAAADRAKDDFLAMLGHELRNPLAPIRTAVHLLKMGPDEERHARALDVLDRQTHNLSRLVDDLLDLSRITRGKIELRRGPVDAREAVRHAVESVGPAARELGHDLKVRLPERPGCVDADPTRLEQIVANLLTNAVKYTPPGGRIEVALETDTDTVRIRVTDNGMGMDEQLLARAFDLFQQGTRSLDRSQGGLGIGLTLVRRLVEMHDGQVSARSPGPGLGSTLEVVLPRLDGTLEALGDRPQDEVHARRRVLVVDDNEDAAELLATLLREWGHDVAVAYDGPAALQRLDAFQPEVVFLDIGLPGMSGYEVAREIRAHPVHHDVTIVAITGYGQDEDRVRSFEAGFDMHLTKPVDFEAVEEVLQH